MPESRVVISPKWARWARGRILELEKAATDFLTLAEKTGICDDEPEEYRRLKRILKEG